MQLPLTGGCICGAIRYTVARTPIEVYACHCTDCQRITSSAFSIGVVIADDEFSVTGKAAISVPGGVTAGGRVKRRWVCPDCGTWLFGNPRPGTQPAGMIRVVRGQDNLLLFLGDFRLGVLEIEARGQFLSGLIKRVVDLLIVDF